MTTLAGNIAALAQVVGADVKALQGAVGGSGMSYTTAAAVSGHIAVVLNANGACLPADCEFSSDAYVAGITTHAAALGSSVAVVIQGTLEHNGWTWTPGAPIYLGNDGALVQSIPVGALFSKVLGYALSATRMQVDFQPAVFFPQE